MVTKNKIIKDVSTILEGIGVCANQYRHATYFYLLSIIAVRFNVIIDGAVGEPIHGKDVVYGLNAANKNIPEN